MKCFICITALLGCAITLSGKNLEVGASKPFKSIKAAIEAASSGDTVTVHAGQYTEGNILIQKSLALIGVNRPMLDGQWTHEIITIAAPGVLVEGFRLVNGGRSNMDDLAGIKCYDAHHVRIINNELDRTFFGIHLSNTDHAYIAENTLFAFSEKEYELGNGIHLWKCKEARIVNNRVEGHRDGIYFEFVTDSYIGGNTCLNNMRYGLHFMFSHDDTYENNLFRNNGAGVSVMYTRNVAMLNNNFEENWGNAAYGLLLKDIRDSKVIGNRFYRNTSGIYMEGSSRIHFENNEFSANGIGIKLMASCDDNEFTRNNFMNNTFDLTTNGRTVLNSIDGNYWDKYEGYDLDRDGFGDVPYHPVSLFSMLSERVPSAILLWRSFMVFLLDRAEKLIPAATPENLKDNRPKMTPYDIGKRSK